MAVDGHRGATFDTPMTTIPLTLILAGAVILGVILGIEYLRGVRRRPGMIAAHLILGFLAMEQMAMMLRGTPAGESAGSASYGKLTAFLFFIAVLAGLIAALLRDRRTGSNIALAGHVTVATAGVLAYVAWVSRL